MEDLNFVVQVSCDPRSNHSSQKPRPAKTMTRRLNLIIVSNNFCSTANIGSKRWREMAICLQSHATVNAICSDGNSIGHPAIQVENVPLGTKLRVSKSGFAGRSSPNMVIRASRFLAASLLAWPDRQRKWSERAISRIPGFLKEDCANVVITSGPLFSAHTELLRWRRQCQRPFHWVMDQRDLWTNETNPRMQRRFPKFLVAIERRMEQACHDAADLVTTIGERAAARLHQDFGSEPVVLYNGYLRALRRPARIPPQPLLLSYLGTILRGLYSPELLFRAAGKLELRRSGLEFNFRTSAPDVIRKLSSRWNVTGCVTHGDFVKHEQSLLLQENAGANIVLSGTDSTADHWVTGKIFELITANRPILAVAGKNSEIRTVLQSVGVDSVAWNDESAERLLLEFLAGRIPIPEDKSGRYARETAAGVFLQAIEQKL